MKKNISLLKNKVEFINLYLNYFPFVVEYILCIYGVSINTYAFIRKYQKEAYIYTNNDCDYNFNNNNNLIIFSLSQEEYAKR